MKFRIKFFDWIWFKPLKILNYVDNKFSLETLKPEMIYEKKTFA